MFAVSGFAQGARDKLCRLDLFMSQTQSNRQGPCNCSRPPHTHGEFIFMFANSARDEQSRFVGILIITRVLQC